MTTLALTADRCQTPPTLARRWGVSVDQVLAWIRRGELRAMNLASRAGGRPRWKISPEAVATFEAARTSTPALTPVRRARRMGPHAVQYYPE